MSATFWKVFELAISVWENILFVGILHGFYAAETQREKR